MKKILLNIGGVFMLLGSILHLSFWKMGNWGIELKQLSTDNQGIIQMLNIGSIYFVFFSAIITFVIAKKNTLEKTDKLFLMLAGGYYIMRIIFGFPLFGISAEEIIIQAFSLLGVCCYLIPLILLKLKK
jgi:hypothetical protein